jgi:uncharacterized protein YciI
VFVILMKYLVPIEEVEANTADHRAYLDTLYARGKLVCSGPREPRTGGVVIANVATDLEAMKIVADDPFFERKIAEYEVVRFNPVKSDPRFAPFLGAGS